MSITAKSPDYSFKFIGRKAEIDVFYKLMRSKPPRKALYIEAGGGVGKTKLLNEFIRICKDDQWNLGPDNKAEELLIDFYALENRTISGLRRNIIIRIGKEFFPDYVAKDKELRKLPLTGELEGREGRIAALSLELRAIFLRELRAITNRKIKPTALFFDTFESVYNREAGRWFLQEFIPLANEIGLIIVFVGRWGCDSSDHVYKHVLEHFEKTQEYSEYFSEHANALSVIEEMLYELSSGKPLLVELMRFLDWDDFGDELLEKSKNEDTRHVFESRLVQKFINNEDENSFLKVILEMSYLKRRYTRQIFEHRRGQYTNIRDWIHLKGELANYPFVKYYSSSDSFVLHDEFQRMIEEHGRGIFIDKAVELRDDIVKGLYEKFINDAHDDDIKSLLRVEQLAYILNIGGVNDQHQVAPGYQLVDYELAKKKLLEYYQLRSYILDGFLVSEVSTETIVGFPEDDRDELLSLFGQMAQRIYRYEDAQIYWGSVAKYAESIKDYERQVEALISLHSNAWRSNPAQAFEILDQAFEVCEKHVEKLLPRVLNAIGFNYARFQRFEEAIKEYQKALAEVNEGEHRHLKATILNNLGSAYLQIGKMAKAKAHTDAGRRLRQTILEEMIAKKDSSGIETAENRLGYSFVILGTLARYSDDLTSADDEYSYAISIFEKYNDQFARANALLCRGETHRRIARLNFENDQIESVEENEDLAEIDIRAGFDICQQYGLINLLDTAYRRKGRLLHDQGYRAAEVDIKLEYYDKALVEFENALEIAVQTGDVREELENLREIAFLADDHADVVINTENDDKSKIQEEFEQLNAYIARFENSLKKHEKDVYRLYNYDAFQALLILEKAAFAYAREQRDDALNLYIRAFVTLAKSPGYGVANYLIYLPHLFKNIRNLKNPVLEKIWCGKIKDVWEKEKLDNVREEMMANIEVHLLAIGEG